MHFGKVIYRQTKTFVRGEGAKGEKGEDVRLEMAKNIEKHVRSLHF